MTASERLGGAARATLGRLASRLDALGGRLDALSPLSVLSRGYSLVWREPASTLVRSSAEVEPGDPIRIQLAQGALRATVRASDGNSGDV